MVDARQTLHAKIISCTLFERSISLVCISCFNYIYRFFVGLDFTSVSDANRLSMQDDMHAMTQGAIYQTFHMHCNVPSTLQEVLESSCE